MKTLICYFTDKETFNKIVIVFALILLVSGTSCANDDAPPENPPTPEQLFNAKVLGVGFDCGSIFLIQFNDTAQNVPDNLGDKIFYAVNLSEEFKVDDLEIYIVFRELTVDELIVCSTEGPSYPRIYIESVIECYVGEECN